MAEIALNRKQLNQLFEITQHFKEVELFTVEADNTSGIGTGIVVRFNALGVADKDTDTTVNITDVSTW